MIYFIKFFGSEDVLLFVFYCCLEKKYKFLNIIVYEDLEGFFVWWNIFYG